MAQRCWSPGGCENVRGDFLTMRSVHQGRNESLEGGDNSTGPRDTATTTDVYRETGELEPGGKVEDPDRQATAYPLSTFDICPEPEGCTRPCLRGPIRVLSVSLFPSEGQIRRAVAGAGYRVSQIPAAASLNCMDVTRWSHCITNRTVVEYNGTTTPITNDNKKFLPTAGSPKICHFASNPSPRRGPIFDRIGRVQQKRPVEGFGTSLPRLERQILMSSSVCKSSRDPTA